jgi:hypothetical protein
MTGRQDGPRTEEHVRLVLAERGMDFTTSGGIFSLAHGSAHVEIEPVDATPPTVTVRSFVLTDVHPADEVTELALLRRLNELNASLRFGKFYLDEAGDSILVEYEILASHMQAEELLHALAVVKTLADDHDDILKDHIGHGRRAIDKGDATT